MNHSIQLVAIFFLTKTKNKKTPPLLPFDCNMRQIGRKV